MQIIIENTTKVVVLNIHGVDVPARIWEGKTATGKRVVAFITRITTDGGPEAEAEFDRELQEVRPPSRDVDRAFPMRMIL